MKAGIVKSDALIKVIKESDEVTVVEAARLLAFESFPDSVPRLKGIERSDLENASRIVLTLAALDPKLAPRVQEAMEGAGRKQLVLGGTELVALAIVLLFMIQTLLARGRTSEKRRVEVFEEADGRKRIVIEQDVEFGVSSGLAEAIQGAMKAPGSDATPELNREVQSDDSPDATA